MREVTLPLDSSETLPAMMHPALGTQHRKDMKGHESIQVGSSAWRREDLGQTFLQHVTI